jgi:hypothetical protein
MNNVSKPTLMNHPHWSIRGDSKMTILSIPNKNTIGKETEECSISIDEKIYDCEIRGEDIYLYKSEKGKISRSLVYTGKIDSQGTIVVNDQVWFPTNKTDKIVKIAGVNGNSAQCAPCAPCAPCPSLNEDLLKRQPCKQVDCRPVDCKPVPCQSDSQKSIWMYLAIILMVVVFAIIFRASWKYIEQRRRGFSYYDNVGVTNSRKSLINNNLQ